MLPAAVHKVISIIASQSVLAGVPNNYVIALALREPVSTCAAAQEVVTSAALNYIVPVSAHEDLIAFAAFQSVSATVQRIAPASAEDRIVAIVGAIAARNEYKAEAALRDHISIAFMTRLKQDADAREAKA